jgi:thiol reductant ABC exporter CydD subunit
LARKVAVTRRYLAAAAAIGLGSTVCLIAQASLLGTIVQRALVDHEPLRKLLGRIVGLTCAFALRAGLSWLAELAAHRTSAQVTSTLRRLLLKRTVELGPTWLAGERTGELTSVVTQGIGALDVYFARYLPTAVVGATAPLVLLAWIGWTDWVSLVILGVTVAVTPVFMILLGLEAKRQAERQWQRLSGLSATFYDLLQGLPTLRAFGRARSGRRSLEQAADDFRLTTMSTLRVAFLSSLALELLSAVGVALVALFLGLGLLHGSLHLGVALAVLVLAPEVYLPIRRSASEFHASTEGQAAAERILDLLEEPGAERTGHADDSDAERVNARNATITLNGIKVLYANRAVPALDELSLELRAGDHVAVTGESGSGKSTLLAVLLGFVQPTNGAVNVGGVDLANLCLRQWREQISWVPQRPYLIRGTIADNIRLGNPEAGDDLLASAVQRSGLSGLIGRLERGLDTPVGEAGLTLSAGERQRIAIARAVMRDAPLVLLDEPAAHLDQARELELRETLGPWLENRTVLLTAHRRGLLGRVDRIVELNGGHLTRPTETSGSWTHPQSTQP